MLSVLADRHTEALLTQLLASWKAVLLEETPSAASSALLAALPAARDGHGPTAEPSPAEPSPTEAHQRAASAAQLFDRALHSRAAKAFDVAGVVGGAELAATLWRLLSSHHAPLARAALHLLLTTYGRAHALLSAASQTLVLAHDDSDAHLLSQRARVAALASLVEQYELWGGLATPPDARRMTRATQLLDELTMQCVPPAEATQPDHAPPHDAPPDDDDGTTAASTLTDLGQASLPTPTPAPTPTPSPSPSPSPSPHRSTPSDFGQASEVVVAAFLPSARGSVADGGAQMLLRHLGVADAVFGLLRLPLDAGLSLEQLDRISAERRALHAANHRLVGALCTNNALNAALFAAHWPLLLSHARAMPHSAIPMLLHLYRGHRDLCASAPRALLAMLVRTHLADFGQLAEQLALERLSTATTDGGSSRPALESTSSRPALESTSSRPAPRVPRRGPRWRAPSGPEGSGAPSPRPSSRHESDASHAASAAIPRGTASASCSRC